MSLLQGLIGFGIGATQAIAETKKQDMAAQRQLNLAKLKAEAEANAKSGQTSAEVERRFQLANLPADQRDMMAWIYGESQPPSADSIDPADNLEIFKDEYTQRTTIYNKATGKAYDFVGGELVPRDATSYQEIFGYMGGQEAAQETAPPPMIARQEATSARTAQAPATPMAADALIQPEAKSQLEEALGYKLTNDMSLFDYASAIAGPFDRSIGFLSRFNVVGDIIDVLGGEATTDATKRAVDSSKFLQRYMAQAYAYNAEGRKNIEDIKIGKELLSGTGSGLGGWFMRDEDAYKGLLRVRDFLLTDIEQASNKSQSRTLPASARREADSFLANAAPLLPLLDSYIGGYLVSNTGAKPPGSNETKPIAQWTPEEISAITSLSSAQRAERYNEQQRNAITVWMLQLQRRMGQ